MVLFVYIQLSYWTVNNPEPLLEIVRGKTGNKICKHVNPFWLLKLEQMPYHQNKCVYQ